jgi:hypothetical protein
MATTGTSTPTETETETAHDARQLLGGYLQDHHAAGQGGLALARRCHHHNLGTEFDRELGELAATIEHDAEQLRTIMDALGVQPSRTKTTAVRVGELAARLKANGRLFDYSPASRVLELEGLIAGINAKRGLWHSLLAADQQAIRRTDLEELSASADQQLGVVDALHRRAARIAFDPASR